MATAVSEVRADIIPVRDLSAAEESAWLIMQAAEPRLASPLLSPGFARAVGAFRDDVRIAVYRQSERPVAFLAFHSRPAGLGRPVGTPFADYHGLVCEPGTGLTGNQILKLAGLKAFMHNGLIDPFGLFPAPERELESFTVTLDENVDDYLEARRAASPKKFKNYRRLKSRLAEIGPLRLVADTDQSAFETILAWKSAQYVRTGLQDVLRPQWTSRFMQSLFDTRSGNLTGLLLTLYAGDRLVAGHFGVRGGDIYHPWIASTAPDLAAYSPGQSFMHEAIRAMPELGLRTYDLGVGHDHYKRPYAPLSGVVGAGYHVLSQAGVTESGMRNQSLPLGAVGRSPLVRRLGHRLDHIAATDPTLKGRVDGLFQAVVATRKRLGTMTIDHD